MSKARCELQERAQEGGSGQGTRGSLSGEQETWQDKVGVEEEEESQQDLATVPLSGRWQHDQVLDQLLF